MTDSRPRPQLDTAVQNMIDATNAEDSAAFLDSFADGAVVDDGGRRFVGRDEIARWNATENIGTHNRVAVHSVRHIGDDVEVSTQVSGNGYNGDATFRINLTGGLIKTLTIG